MEKGKEVKKRRVLRSKKKEKRRRMEMKVYGSWLKRKMGKKLIFTSENIIHTQQNFIKFIYLFISRRKIKMVWEGLGRAEGRGWKESVEPPKRKKNQIQGRLPDFFYFFSFF